MSPKDKSVSAIATSAINGTTSVRMPDSPVQTFFTTMRTLASDNGYKEIESMYDEIPRLKEQVVSKDSELEQLRADIARLKGTHEDILQANLELYTTKHNKLNEEKAELSENTSTLKTTIRQRDGDIAELNKIRDGLRTQLDKVEKLLGDEKKKVATANKAITELHQSLKAKDIEIDELKENLNNEKSQVSSLESRLKDIQKENTSLTQNLRTNTARVAELEGFAAKLHEDDEELMINRLEDVWESACRLMESYFKQDLSSESLENQSAWERLRESSFLDRKIPLPQSNSPAAKQMRIAAMLAIAARCINQYIFQPTYILDEESGIRELLVRQAVTDSKKESFCRGLLLSMYPEDQAITAKNRMDRVIREVAWHVQDLFSVAHIDNFRTDLAQVVQTACDAWQTIQHATERFEPFFNLIYYEDLQWQELSFGEGGTGAEEQGTTKATEYTSDEELLVIFPRIYIVQDGEPSPITPGTVLRRSQSLAAVQELDRNKPSSPIVGKGPIRSRTQKPRRMSVSVHGGSPFLSEEAPSSARGGG